MLSCLPKKYRSRFKNRSQGSTRKHGVDGEAVSPERTRESVSIYYDARQSLSDEVPFVPLVLEGGACLGKRDSMVKKDTSDIQPTAVAREQKARQSARMRRSSFLFKKGLEETPKVLDLPSGYPGHLTEEELGICIEFRKRLKEGDPIRQEMVFYFSDIEPEAHAVCRYLRARKFNLDATLEMIDGYIEKWNEGKRNDFFPDASAILGGAPESALLGQFPFILGKIARNGCPVLYEPVKLFSVDGTECVAPLEDVPPYFWHFVVHKLRRSIAKAQAEDPSRFVRLQVMVVVDLEGMPVSTLTRCMGALQNILSILSVFPELLFNVCVLNVPRFFAAFWPAIKAVMDPNTAKKVELFTDPVKGKQRLLELIDAPNLASDFGGTGDSIEEIIMQQATDSEHGKVGRQVVELISINKQEQGVLDVELEEHEIASITVYTKSENGATISISEGTEIAPEKVVTLARREGATPDRLPFFQNVASALPGPGAYRLAITGAPSSSPPKYFSSSPPKHFLVVANVLKD